MILISDQGSDVGLDTASTEANDDDSRDVSSEGVASGDRRGKGGCPQNQKTDPVDSGEDQDRVVFAEILIGDDGSENGSDCVKVSTMIPDTPIPKERFNKP